VAAMTDLPIWFPPLDDYPTPAPFEPGAKGFHRMSGARAIAAGTIDAVALFSPRTAKTFVRLAARAGLEAALAGTDALCLSEAVAGAARALSWRAVRIAERPDQEALVALLAPAAARSPCGAERSGRR